MIKPVTTWILIADGAQARILSNTGPGKGVSEIPKSKVEIDLPPSREIGTDRPGRTFESADSTRHAKEPSTDPHRHRKEQFAISVSGTLQKALQRASFDRLVVVAPPAALGDLRKHLSAGVKAKVVAEIPKDLTNVPNPEIPRHLEDVIAV